MAAVASIVPIVSHAVSLKSPGPHVHCFVQSGRFFRKVLSVELPLTHRFVYILVSEKFVYSECTLVVVSSLRVSTTKSGGVNKLIEREAFIDSMGKVLN